jgi:hypothetical protein
MPYSSKICYQHFRTLQYRIHLIVIMIIVIIVVVVVVFTLLRDSLKFFNTISRRGDAIFYEFLIYLNLRSRIVFFCTEQNVNFYQEMEHNPPHVMKWAAVESARTIFSPFFFKNSVDQNTCLTYVQRLVNANT